MRSIRWPCLLAGSVLLTACGGTGPAADGADAVVRPAPTPSRAGEAWELADAAVGQAPSPAAVAAFVEGLHSIVLDGDRVYAGSVRRQGDRQGDGSLVLALAGGGQARLVRDGDGYALDMGDGAAARLQRRANSTGGAQ
ncbi:MAG TPA: hypothetical protein VIO59_01165 [Rhodanobacter sp.]|jgi:hypothetical protein